MRLKYFAINLAAVTGLCLCYCWQQIEIIQLAYQQNGKNKTYKELLDRNHYLRYNLVNLNSSSSLGKKLLADNTVFEIPKSSQVRVLQLSKLEAAFTGSRKQGQSENKKLSFLGFAGSGKGIVNGAFNKLQDSWPIESIDAYINRYAQAQDMKDNRR
ncbi:hypothetical protein EPN16_05085 [bacterium]|nr:MAG: hypothetical protein EPN16_05085 [bacterium]